MLINASTTFEKHGYVRESFSPPRVQIKQDFHDLSRRCTQP